MKSMKGFKLVDKDRNFFVYYTDYETPRPNDEVGLRTAYRGSVGTLLENSKARGQAASLLSQKDVFLHDKAGN